MNDVIKMPSQQLIREVIQQVAVGPDRGRDVSLQEARNLMHSVLNEQMDEVQIAVVLIALRMKRESLDECRGLFTAMQDSVQTVEADVSELVCLADPFDGYLRHFPMSPFMPIVLAACGLPSLMHGVESVGPKHGVTACKVYKLAGYDVSLDASLAAKNLAEIGWAYIDQSQYAANFFALQQLRDRIVKRTVLTTLERLLMPIRARDKTHLVLGYVHKAYPQIYAAIAKLAGYDTALLVKGVEGGVTPALNKPLRRFFFEFAELQDQDFDDVAFVNNNKELTDAVDFVHAGSAAHQVTDDIVQGSSAAVEKCLSLGLEVLAGKQGAARDSLCLAAAQVLFAHKRSNDLQSAVIEIQKCLDSGKAQALFTKSC